MRAMRTSAATFFLRPACPLSWEARRLATWHMELGRILASSHIQLLAQPITVHYQVHYMVQLQRTLLISPVLQEGTSIGPGLSSTYAAITTVTLGKVIGTGFLTALLDIP